MCKPNEVITLEKIDQIKAKISLSSMGRVEKEEIISMFDNVEEDVVDVPKDEDEVKDLTGDEDE